MPRYTFTIMIGEVAVADAESRVLRDPDAAWEAAGAMAAALVASNPDPRLVTAAMEVRDAGGDVVFVLPFAEAIDLSSGTGRPVQ